MYIQKFSPNVSFLRINLNTIDIDNFFHRAFSFCWRCTRSHRAFGWSPACRVDRICVAVEWWVRCTEVEVSERAGSDSAAGADIGIEVGAGTRARVHTPADRRAAVEVWTGAEAEDDTEEAAEERLWVEEEEEEDGTEAWDNTEAAVAADKSTPERSATAAVPEPETDAAGADSPGDCTEEAARTPAGALPLGEPWECDLR